MLKRHLLYTLLMTATFASCSKQSAIVVKEEVAPPPEVYTSTMAIDDLSSVNKSNINEVINRISSRMVNDSDWSYFWKGMNMQNNSYDWDIETLLKIIDLSRISCGKSASASFSNFIQQILNRVEGLEKEQVLIRALNHFETCSLKLNKNLVRELLNLYKSIEGKSTQKQFIKSFSLIVNRPIDEDIVDLIDILDSIEDVEEKLSLYYGLRGSYHYKALSDKVIESFDYKEIIDLSFNEKIDLNDSLEFLTLAKYQQLDLSKEKIEKLFKVINKQYLNASSRLEKYNISKFHYDSLRNLRYLSLPEVEKWAVFALENFEDIGRLYPKGSIQRLFLESFKGQRDEIEFEHTDEKIDQLLVLRSKIQHERDSSISVDLYDQLCVLFTDFGVRTFSSNNISDFNKLGCKSFINDGLLKINETVNMPFFSAVHTLGSDIRFDKKPIKLSIINTSQKFIYSKVKDTASTDQYEHIVIPLVFALSPIKDVSRFKVGHKQYLATHYIYKDARLLVPGLDG
ncbi:hypothetical protein, partial [Halobacteriovorax sp.]|uniref:hypothetical protein n=1 Tax=Halobacteriovorax sp. TaxID=2020862 RepID=UPI003565041D